MAIKRDRLLILYWEKKTYKLDQIEEEPGYHNFYYLQDGANTSFLREKLMHISEDL